jgi:hypothetical protein
MGGYRTFKGTPGQYRTIHNWIARKLGKASQCENCNANDGRRFVWANISGEYQRDTSDWAELCYQCHALIDGMGRSSGHHPRIRCKRGHSFSDAYVNPNNGWRTCRSCIPLYPSHYKSKRAAHHPKETSNAN